MVNFFFHLPLIMNTIQVTSILITIQFSYSLSNPSFKGKNRYYDEFGSHFASNYGLDFPHYYSNIDYNNDCSININFAMYANINNGCQSYFICHSGRKDIFVCPQGTLFSEDLMTCDYWYRVRCASRFNSGNELTPNLHSEPVYPQTTVQEQDHDYDFEYPDQQYEPEPPSYYPNNYDIHYNTRPVTGNGHQTPTSSNVPATSSLQPAHYDPEMTTKKQTDQEYSTVNPNVDYNYYYSDNNYEEPEWTFAWIRKPKPNQSESNNEQRTRPNFEFDLTNQLLNPKLKEVGNKETSNAPNPWLFSRPRK